MALHLADDGRHRERGELVAAAAVIPLNRVQQPDGAGLYQVVVLGADPLIPVGELLHQRQVQLHEAVACSGIAPLVVGIQQPEGDRISLASCLLSDGFRLAGCSQAV